MSLDISTKSKIEQIISVLKTQKKTLSCAESCTGGLIASAFVDVSGASEIFEGGVIAYSNSAKKEILQVPGDIVETFGAVSKETVIAMASASAKLFNTNFALASTGYAEVNSCANAQGGVMYLALYAQGHIKIEKLRLSHERNMNRKIAVHTAINMLFTELCGGQ